MKSGLRYILLCFSMLYSVAGLFADDGRVVAAEQVAEQYLKYFFSLEVASVVKLTHPETVNAIYHHVKSDYLNSKAAGDLEGFKSRFFLATIPVKFEEWSPEKWYMEVIIASNGRAPAGALEILKQKTVDSIDSRRINDSTVEVFLTLGPPDPVPKSSLILKMHNGKWKVLGNGADG